MILASEDTGPVELPAVGVHLILEQFDDLSVDVYDYWLSARYTSATARYVLYSNLHEEFINSHIPTT